MHFRLMLGRPTLAAFFSARDRGVFEVVGVFDPADPGVVNEARRLQPDAIILDFPPGGAKPALITALRKACPSAALVVWARSENPEDAAAAIEASADGYLVQENVSPAKFLEAVRLISQTRLSFFPCSALSFFSKTPSD
ncbi:MAG: hypothetical protein AB1507_05445 [Bacillota bacterium]|nr:hypothetical protein [Thermoanaerobacteraceae bacterium]